MNDEGPSCNYNLRLEQSPDGALEWKDDEPQMSIEESVIHKIRARREMGLKKYGCSMERCDLSRAEWLKHAQEEAMDFAIYLEKLLRDEQNEQSGHPKI